MFDFWISLIKDIWFWIRGKPTFYINEWGTKFWFLNGKLHLEGGPAIEYPSGEKHWYLNGKKYSFEDYIVELERRGLHDEIVELLFHMA